MTTPIDTRPGLRLQDGETLILEGSPAPQMLPASVVGQSLFIGLTVVCIPLLPIIPWAVRRSLGWHRWWLTDRRLVVRTGFIGWTLRSVPLDRIVDVTTRATWWDRIWGLEHINVRDMTGEVGTGGVSSGLSLMGVTDARDVAEQILSATPRALTRTNDLAQVTKLLERIVDRAA